MCDAFLVLAQAPGGLTCYLLPRVLPDGERNAFHIDRLKDKLGNRSNASAEIELDGAWARRVGEEGRGVATIIEMVVHTRLDCVLGSTGLMRRAVAEATHHAAHRSAFGRALVEQPLMQNVLADLCVDSEAATLLALRLARAYDEDDARVSPARDDGREVLGLQGDAAARGRGARVHRRQRLRRGERAAAALPREPAELGVGGACERAGARRPARAAAPAREHRSRAAGDRARGRARRAARRVRRGVCVASSRTPTSGARAGSSSGSRSASQGSLLLRHGAPAVAEAFCATRLGGDGGRSYGTLPRGVDAAAIVERHRPRV